MFTWRDLEKFIKRIPEVYKDFPIAVYSKDQDEYTEVLAADTMPVDDILSQDEPFLVIE